MKFLTNRILLYRTFVTPFAGVWIEIHDFWRSASLFLSLPSRECGLKSLAVDSKAQLRVVTPFAGVWIEIISAEKSYSHFGVTPFAGVWIEIRISCLSFPKPSSLPSRECGLKFHTDRFSHRSARHSLRGSVD